MDIQEILSRNILYYLKIKDKNQSDLAKDLKIHKTVVSSWVNQTNFPRPDKIMLLANYFGINFVDLFTNKDDNNDNLEELIDIANQLDKEYRNIIIEQAKTLLKMQKKK